MRPQEHAKISAVAAVVAWPWLKNDVWIPYTASILIDVDHYCWHAITQRTLSLRAMARYFRQGKAPDRPEVRLLHQPMTLGVLLLLAVGTRSRLLGLILSGLVFHVCLDRYHQTQTRYLKRILSERVGFKCAHCGEPHEKLEMHMIRRPRNLRERYSPDTFIVLCPACHRKSHQKKTASPQTVLSSDQEGPVPLSID